MRVTSGWMLLAALVAPLAARAADPRAQPIDEHLQHVADALAPHLADLVAAPRVEAIEKTPPIAHVRGEALEISTGLLSVMENDAQAAMILAHAMARASQPQARRGAAPGGTGAQVGRAAVVGATVGLVAAGTHDALGDSSVYALGTVGGAASAAAGTAVASSMSGAPANKGAERRADEEATATAMRAVIAAGYDGREAIEAWARLAPLSSLAEDERRLGDREANARRADVARRTLRQSGQVGSTHSGLATGATAYRAGVLAHLRGWKLIDQALPSGASAPATAPPADTGAWLTYMRSGGITGWMAELRIGPDGSTWVRESRRAGEAGPRAPLSPEALAQLRELVSAALARPARAMTADARFLRDGVTRTLRVRDDARDTTLGLSDGLQLSPDDQALLRELELHVR